MSAGIAKSIAAQFPQAYEADLLTAKGDRAKLGTGSFNATPVSYAVGTFAPLACLPAARAALPAWSRVLAAPWWA